MLKELLKSNCKKCLFQQTAVCCLWFRQRAGAGNQSRAAPMQGGLSDDDEDEDDDEDDDDDDDDDEQSKIDG